MTARPHITWLVALALVTAVLAPGLSGCGGSGGPAPFPESSTAAAETAVTPPAAGLLSPAIGEILAQVVAQRALAAPAALRVGAVSRSGLPAVIAAALTAEDRSWFARTTLLYRLLGYIGPADDYLGIYLEFAKTAVGALYDPATASVWLVAEAPGALDAPDAGQRSLIAHELVHALQDEAFGLERAVRGVQDNLDRNLALASVIEGDAVGTERRFARWPAGGGAVLFAAGSAAFQGVPPAIERELRFPYTTGAEWVAGLRREGGNAAIDALLRTPPAATAAILHPALGPEWRPEVVSLPPIAQALGGNWRRSSTGTLGEFHLGNFLQQQLKGLEAIQAAEGWTGDEYDLYMNGKQSVAVFRVHFRNAEEAVQFTRAYETWLTAAGAKAFASKSAFGLSELANGTTYGLTQPSGVSVTWVIGSDRASAEAAASALTNG